MASLDEVRKLRKKEKKLKYKLAHETFIFLQCSSGCPPVDEWRGCASPDLAAASSQLPPAKAAIPKEEVLSETCIPQRSEAIHVK